MEIAPVPAEPIPVYFGGRADAVLKRAARIGDGYIGTENAGRTLDDLPALMARLRDLGITDAVVWPWYYYPGDPNDLDHKIGSLRRFAEEIAPQFKGEE